MSAVHLKFLLKKKRLSKIVGKKNRAVCTKICEHFYDTLKHSVVVRLKNILGWE